MTPAVTPATRGRSRGRWAAAVLLLAAAAGGASLPAWVRATGVSALTGDVVVTVPGSTAAPVVPATALVLAAAGAAIALAGRVGRWVVAAVVLASGVALAVAGAAVVADPQAPALAAAAERTGVDHLTGPAAATAAPWVAVLLGVLASAAAVALSRSSAAWAAPSARHEVAAAREAPGAAPDERSDWDALSRGADPSTEP